MLEKHPVEMTLCKRLKMQISILLNENAFLPDNFIFKGEDLLLWLKQEIKEIKGEKKGISESPENRETPTPTITESKEQKMHRPNKDLRTSKDSKRGRKVSEVRDSGTNSLYQDFKGDGQVRASKNSRNG